MSRDCHFHLCEELDVDSKQFHDTVYVHEPFSWIYLRDSCVTSSKRLSMILKFSSMWTTSSAWVASSHDRKPMLLLFVVVVFILLFLLTRSNRLQPIIIHYQRFLAITTVSCCIGHVCALVFILYSLPVRIHWAIIYVVWTRLENIMFASYLQILYRCILSITRLKWTNWRIRNHASSKETSLMYSVYLTMVYIRSRG